MLKIRKTSQSMMAIKEVKLKYWVIDSSTHSQKSRLEKANGVGIACKVAN